jgi:hypothetical protein
MPRSFDSAASLLIKHTWRRRYGKSRRCSSESNCARGQDGWPSSVGADPGAVETSRFDQFVELHLHEGHIAITAHNVTGRRGGAGIRDFPDHLETLPDALTTIDTSSRAGASISCKK